MWILIENSNEIYNCSEKKVFLFFYDLFFQTKFYLNLPLINGRDFENKMSDGNIF
jgi:hypothetical protein